jgi:acetyltransferase-like isoleucine patch superfamily enzyme
MKKYIFAILKRLRTHMVILKRRSFLTSGPDLHIGRGADLWAPNFIKIGRSVYIGKDVTIECNCTIGDYCLIANRVALVGRHDHDFRAVGFPVRFAPWVASKKLPNLWRAEAVVVESDVWIGFGSIVLTGMKIGRGGNDGAGSIVTKDVPPYAIAAGAPARVVDQRFEKSDVAAHEAGIAKGRFKSPRKVSTSV